jgi:superfamily II DNA or RNA helicase
MMSTSTNDVKSEDFYEKITKKYAKYAIPKKKPTFDEICFPKGYKLQNQQLFLPEFINPNNNYRGILLFHRIGGGKTCTAIRIALNFIDKKIKVIVVLPASLKENFKGELRTLCAGDRYIKISERDKLSKLNVKSHEYQEIIKLSEERIKKDFNIYSYNKFIQDIKDINIDNSLLIIDEAHNMVSEDGLYYEELYKKVIKAKNLKLVLMTATPIFDKPMEIALLLNLLPLPKKLPTGIDFYNKYVREHNNNFNMKNISLFKDRIKGFVSYYKGAPKYTYPAVKIKIVKCEMQGFQLKMYKSVVALRAEEEFSSSFYIGARLISNIAFPNGKLDDDNSLMPRHMELERLQYYSIKFYHILLKLKKAKGPVFIYSNFKENGGIKSIIKVLEYHGYQNYLEHGPGKKRFAIWSGDQNDTEKREIRTIFNLPENKNASQIKIILGSPSIKEGVSLFRVRHVHIIEPYWNMSRMDQVIGRAVRFCSHKDLDEDERNVKVYIYLAIIKSDDNKDVGTIDQKIFHIAITKQKLIKQFERAMKEAAVDCHLFKNGNSENGDFILCDN